MQIVDAVAARLGPRSRLAILDHVSSLSAVVFPVRELTSLCHEADASVLIDGAHAPGMLSLDIAAIGADWYVGNCHKWLMAPKGSGFLFSPFRLLRSLEDAFARRHGLTHSGREGTRRQYSAVGCEEFLG
jgi:selenocysteine lyase/cysteine desulfurase